MFHVTVSVTTAWELLHRTRVHPAAPHRSGRGARRTSHRAPAALSMAGGKRVARRLGAWICFADESGITLRPARARTGAPRGKTSIVTVAGRGGRKLSVAGIAAYRAGERSRLLYRVMVHRDAKASRKASVRTTSPRCSTTLTSSWVGRSCSSGTVCPRTSPPRCAR
jgi:hypothetical protein